MRTLSKVNCLALLASLLSATAVSAEELTVWSWDKAGEAMMFVAGKYNETNPEIKVTATLSQVYDQLTAGCAAGGANLPDIVSIENSEVERYLQQFPECFVELGQFGANEVKPLFPDYKWAELQNGDAIYGIPWDGGQVVTFYRTDLFKDNGITVEDIATWDGYIEAGKKLLAATNGETRMATSNYTSGLNWFGAMAQQLGCSIFGEKDGNVTIRVNQPGCVRALEELKKLVDADVIAAGGWDDQLTALKNNKTASSIYGAWYEGSIRSTMPEQDGRWGITRMPAFEAGGNRAANIGGSSLFVTVASKHPEQAYAFIKYALTSPEMQMEMLKQFGLVPTLLSSASDPYMDSAQPFWGGQAIWREILETTADIEPTRSTAFGAESTAIVVAVQAAYIEGKTASAQAALDEAAAQIKAATGLEIE